MPKMALCQAFFSFIWLRQSEWLTHLGLSKLMWLCAPWAALPPRHIFEFQAKNKRSILWPSPIDVNMKYKTVCKVNQCQPKRYLSRMVWVYSPSHSLIAHDNLNEFSNLRFQTKYQHLASPSANSKSLNSIYSTVNGFAWSQYLSPPVQLGPLGRRKAA